MTLGQSVCPNGGCEFPAGHESEHPCGHPYETGARVSSTAYEKMWNIQVRTVAALLKLRWSVSLARRGVGLRPLRRRVVPGHLGQGSRLRPAVRRHSDRRGFTVTVAHPESDAWRVDLLSVRWGESGRGVHPHWEWIEKVAHA